MKILHIISSLEGGGTEASLITFLKKSPNILENYVCAINKGGVYENELKQLNIPYIILNRHFKLDVSLIRQIQSIAKNNNFDIAQMYNYTASLWGRLAFKKNKIKKLVYERGTIWGTNKIRNIVDKYLIKYTDQFIANSNAAKLMLNFKLNIPLDKIIVINNGIIPPKIQNPHILNNLRKSLNIENYQYIIGFVGRLNPVKGIDILIDATKELLKKEKNVVLLIVGDGIWKKHYIERVYKENLTNNIKFLGFRKDVQTIIQLLDIIILPSITESFPNVLLEAMFLKTPIIASNVDGISEIIDDEITGILIEPTEKIYYKHYPRYHYNGKKKKITKTKAISHIALSEKILYLLKNKIIQQKFIKNGYKKAMENYKIERYMDNLINLYEKIL